MRSEELAARELATPSSGHAKLGFCVAEMNLEMLVWLNLTLKGQPCAMA
jgi:hypothetical protein